MKDRTASVTFLLLTTALILPSSARAQAGEDATAEVRQPPSATAEIGTATPPGPATASIPAPVVQPSALARGTMLLAEFSGSLNARKLKPGDKVKAVLTQDLIVGGKVVARSESKLVGHVTEVKARSAQDPESRLGVVFDKILLKPHKELEIEAVVQALAPPAPRRSRVDEPDQMMPPPMLGVAAPGGRGSNSSSSAGRSNSTTTLASSVTSLGVMTTVQSAPGSNPGDSMSTIRPMAANNKPITAGTGVHGVYGLKNLSLSSSTTGTNPGPVIVSTKSNVKLESGTQVVLLVNK